MSGPINKNMNAAQWGLLILLSVLWGGSFFFAEIALRELPVFTIVLGRVGIAALLLHVLIRFSGHHFPLDFRLWATFAGMGAMNNLVPFTLIVWGQSHIDSGLASILNATTPFFTVLFAHAFTSDEKMTWGRISGIGIGIAGVAIMIGPEALHNLEVNTLAQIAVLGAAMSYALAGIFGRRFRKQPPLVTAAGQVSATTIMLLPIVLILDTPWRLEMPGLAVLSAVFGLALLCTVVAYVIYFRLLASAGATNLLLVTFLIPVSAILLGVVFLGEVLGTGEISGMALIGLGLVAIDGRVFHILRRRS